MHLATSASNSGQQSDKAGKTNAIARDIIAKARKKFHPPPNMLSPQHKSDVPKGWLFRLTANNSVRDTTLLKDP